MAPKTRMQKKEEEECTFKIRELSDSFDRLPCKFDATVRVFLSYNFDLLSISNAIGLTNIIN